MSHTADTSLASTQDFMIEAVNEREQGGTVKTLTSSTGSLSSSTSKEGVFCNSRKAERKKRGGKRKAAVRTSPYVQPAPAPALSKPPPIIRRLSADKSHFKDIVHQFTGLPCPPPLPQPRLPILSPCNTNFLAAAISESLHTLDTISAYLLLHGSSQENNILLNEINKSKSLTFLQALKQQDSLYKGTTIIPSAMVTQNSSSTIGGVDFKSSCPSTSNCGGVDMKSSCPSTTNCGGVDFKSLFVQTPLKDIIMGNLGGQELPHANMPSTHTSQQIADLETILLKDSTTQDNFFSLAWLLLKKMASQQTPLAL